MINFAQIKSLSIPEGAVKSVSINGVTVWRSGDSPSTPVEPTYTNQLPRAQDIASDDAFNGCGYMTSAYLSSSSPFYNSTNNANEWVTGCISYTIDKPIYIKGVSFTTASHDRMYFFSSKTTRVAPGVSGSTLATYFTVEQLGTNYHKLTPISGSGLSATTQYVRMSFTTGTPSDVIITVDEPIE